MTRELEGTINAKQIHDALNSRWPKGWDPDDNEDLAFTCESEALSGVSLFARENESHFLLWSPERHYVEWIPGVGPYYTVSRHLSWIPDTLPRAKHPLSPKAVLTIAEATHTLRMEDIPDIERGKPPALDPRRILTQEAAYEVSPQWKVCCLLCFGYGDFQHVWLHFRDRYKNPVIGWGSKFINLGVENKFKVIPQTESY